jgi:hypothetical protein
VESILLLLQPFIGLLYQLWKIGDDEECRLLGCYAVWLLKDSTFWRNLSPLKRILTRATRRNIPEESILHNYRREYLKSWIDGDDIGAIIVMNELQGKPKYSEKICATDPK